MSSTRVALRDLPFGRGSTRWPVLALLLALGAVAAVLYATRHSLLIPVLRAPYACRYGAGCVDVSPPVAALVMFGFDGLLVALAAWQLTRGGFFEAPVGATPSRLQWRLGLGLVAAMALAGRFALQELAEFRFDETDLAWLAMQGLQEGRLALTGIEFTIRIPHPPGPTYLLAPVLALFQDRPGAPAALITYASATSAATSLLCAWFTRRWTGSGRAGLVAGTAYALGFWPLFLGRRLWTVNFFPPFTVLFFDALLVLALRRQGRALLWAAGWLALMVQLHYLAAALLPLLLAAAWLGRRALRLGTISASLVLSLLLLSPFILWELSFDNFLRDLRHAMALLAQPAVVDTLSIQFVANLASAWPPDSYIQPQATAFAGLAQVPLGAAGAGTFLLGAGLLACASLALRGRQPDLRIVAAFLLGWMLLPTILLLRHSLIIKQHYFYHLLPGMAVLMGLALAWPELAGRPASGGLLRLGRRVWRVVGSGLLSLHLAGSVVVLGLLLPLLEHAPGRNHETPLGFLSAAGQAAYDAWRTYGDGQPVVVGGERRDVEKMRLAMGASVPWVAFDDCVELAVPAPPQGRAVYFLRENTPTAELLLQHPGAQLLVAVERPNGSPFRVFLVATEGLHQQRFPKQAREEWPDCAEREYGS